MRRVATACALACLLLLSAASAQPLDHWLYLPLVRAAVDIRILAIDYAGLDEIVTLQLVRGPALSLAGWRLQSYNGEVLPCLPQFDQVYAFPPGLVLQPGDLVRLHSGPQGGQVIATTTDLPWTTALIWNNTGDRADLLNPAGQVVATYGYGGCR